MIKLLVLALRGGSIGARFLLSFLFIKHISLEFQGEYALLLTTVTLCMLIVGFDFYVFANRFLIKNQSKVGFTLTNQLMFHLLTYAVLLTVFFILRLSGITHDYLMVTVLFLLVFEHLGMEFFRAFIALEKVLIANIILFIRTGTWPLILIYQLLFTELEVTLDTVINYWLIAGLLSVLLGFILIRGTVKRSKFSFDKEWVLKGFKVGALFLVATMANKIVEFSDRYIIDAFLGAKSLGIYSFFFQLANVVNVFIFTVFISFVYPKIIYLIDNKRKKEAYKVMRKLRINCILTISIYTLALFFILPYLLDFIDKSELYDHQIILYLFLLGNMFLNLSFTSHYALMAIEKDKALMWIGIGIATLTILGNLIAINLFGITGGVSVFVLSSILFFITKSYAEKTYFRRYEW